MQEIKKKLKKIEIQEYRNLINRTKLTTPIFDNCIGAFIVGGLICALGQYFANILQNQGMSFSEAIILSLIILIFIVAFLTGLGLYKKLGKIAGAGILIPISGLANMMTASGMEYKKQGYIIKTASRIFDMAGPVIVFSIISSMIVGLIFFLIKYV